MGFKCPICSKDFKTDKSSWEEHIKSDHDGTGLDFLNVLKSATGDKKD